MHLSSETQHLPLPALLHYLLRVGVVFAAYFYAGRIGLAVPFTDANVSPVWPPAGIALAAVLLWGYRIWPGIALGAFLVNYLTPIPMVAALGIAVGSTSGPLTAGWLLRRFARFEPSLGRLRDVLSLMVLGSAGPVIAATIGVGTLFLTDVDPWSSFAPAWLIWCAGDLMGVLIVVPVVLTARAVWQSARENALEKLLLLASTVLVCLFIFGDSLRFTDSDDVLTFGAFPFVLWAAIRFGVGWAALTSLLIASLAVWHTNAGSGPFEGRSPFQNAALLQLYLAFIAVSGPLLAVVVRERERAESALERERLLAAERHKAEMEKARLNQELRSRLHQQAVISELGQLASAFGDLTHLMDAVVRRVADTLEVEYCNVLELLPERNELLLRAGVGWREGVVGSATVAVSPDSQAGYTLLCKGPVIVEDLGREARFRDASFLPEHEVISGMSVVIHGESRPFGVLGAHTRTRRLFTNDDTNFLQAAANVLSAATQRKQTEEVLLRSEKLAASGRLAATIAHEINNPLAAIMNIAYLLGMRTELEPETRALLETMQQELQRVAHITRQTLGFYREASAPVAVKLAEVIEDVLAALEPGFRGHGITVKKCYRCDGYIEAQPVEMRQIFANLVLNAFEAVGAGGCISVEIDGVEADGMVQVLLRDNGPGVRPEVGDRIFEPFFSTKGGKGTGLGLWVAQGIVQKHGGRLSMTSITEGPEHGTTFSVLLPSASTRAGASAR